MQSISIDYLFNRIYDVLLWIKYVWLFVFLRKNPDEYLAEHTIRPFDGLRDRGWFTEYLTQKDALVPPADVHISLWQRTLESLGINLPDSDKDGQPDVTDSSPYDASNLTDSQLKERYQADYTLTDKVRDLFGIGPKDSDKDGVPNSYEVSHGMDKNNADGDRDGVFDGQELKQGTDTLNSDTDGDLVLDGRDEAPLDGTISARTTDTDGDGVGDSVEGIIGSDIYKRDTDGDGIPDNMDTYPLDATNASQITPFDIDGATSGLYFSVQNPVLSLFTDLLSILAVAVVIAFVYVVFRWFLTFLENLNDYENHFNHGGNDGSHHGGHGSHVIKDSHQPDKFAAWIPGLPVQEETPAEPPTNNDFEDHPRFAIVQGYMSSTSEALWRIGILEADNMLAHVLRDKGYVGETVADMLKVSNFQTVQLAWDAHGVRNRIAHEGSDFQLTEREAKRAYALYESVFRELKVIR